MHRHSAGMAEFYDVKFLFFFLQTKEIESFTVRCRCVEFIVSFMLIGLGSFVFFSLFLDPLLLGDNVDGNIAVT